MLNWDYFYLLEQIIGVCESPGTSGVMNFFTELRSENYLEPHLENKIKHVYSIKQIIARPDQDSLLIWG